MIKRQDRWRWPRRVLLALLAIVVIAVASATVVLRRSLPDHEGTVVMAGLGAEVTVLRDANAVPHIFAATMADAYRALGYLHAQDRFFQMEMMRRAGAGRLSEALGQATLSTDRFLRALGIYALAEQSLANLDPESIAALDAYAAGVNAWLATDPVLPPEFLVLRVDPEPWRPADSLVWGRLMALQLAGNLRDEILRARLSMRLEPSEIDDLWADDPPGSAATLPDLAGLYGTLGLDTLAAGLPDIFAAASASNAWVVSGDHTATGAPLLANDPHLGLDGPVMWYLARIVTPDATIVGATVPGVPATILGHNGAIAWGFTTTGADTQDLFIERLDPDDPSRYLTPTGSEPFMQRQETIAVRGQDPEVMTVRATRHGVVMTGISSRYDNVAEGLHGQGHVVALASTTLAAGDRTADALFRLNRARNWLDFRNATALVGTPVQNIMYADITGAIGFVTAGRIPMRIDGDGTAPVPGWTGDHDWRGFVPPDQAPAARNPAAGRIVNANNRIVTNDFRPFIARDWAVSFRADRINQSLDAAQAAAVPHDTASFSGLQQDAVTLVWPLTRPWLAAAAERITAEPASDALALLLTWDGVMDRARPEPLIFAAWLRALGPRIYADELGALAANYGSRARPRVVAGIIADTPAWCDNIDQQGTQTCDDQVAAAFTDAVSIVSADLGDDPASWQWGDQHRTRFAHPIFGRIPLVHRFTDIVVPTHGGDFTVNRGTARPGRVPFEHIHGAGLRAVYDLGDLGNSRFMIATGQSGHPLSRHYRDLTQTWADGGTMTLRGSPAALTRNAARVLTLRPANAEAEGTR